MRSPAVAALGVSLLFASGAFAQTLINGAGATFPYPIYSKWFNEYRKLHPDVQFNYQPIGSGGGIRQLQTGTVDFGASDQPVEDAQLAKFKIQPLQLPTVLGGVVPVYNVPGVAEDLNFTPKAIAGIYLGTIRRWNDPEIARANPGAKLPASDIVPIHRSDGSGTTFIWTDFLSKTDSDWKNRVGSGTSVSWPAGLGAKGNEGVAGMVKQTPNSFGYVELIYAIQNKMPFGRVRNASGAFVKASLASVTAAASGAAMPADFRVSITNAAGKDAYPVSSFTWLLIPTRVPDAAKKRAIVDFLNWMLGPGQGMTESLSYAPLPKQVVAQERKAISAIQ
jgi:phosphate transport system substrate-binding protein